MKKASTIDVDIQFTEDDGITAINITGATSSAFMIKDSESADDASALINKTPTTNATDAAQGKCSTSITATEANNLPANKPLYCEAFVVLAGGRVVRTQTQRFVLQNNLIKAIS